MRHWLVGLTGVCVWLQTVKATAFVPLPAAHETALPQAVRVVISLHEEHTTLWLQILLRVTGDRLALVVPVAGGVALDPGESDWFSALEGATAVHVYPPALADFVGCESDGVRSVATEPRADRSEVTALHLLSNYAALQQFCEDGAFEDVAQLAPELETHAGTFVTLEYAPVSNSPLLVSLRLQDSGQVEDVLSRLAPLGSLAPVPVTLLALAEKAVVVEATQVIAAQDLESSWFPMQKDTDYLAERKRLVSEGAGETWVIEALGQAALYDGYSLERAVQVPSLVEQFRARLQRRGLTCPDWSASLASARAADERADRYCAEGTLALHGDPACRSEPGADGLDLMCEQVADLALALSGRRLREVVLTRHVGQLPTEARLSLQPLASATQRTPSVQATRVAEAECPLRGVGGSGVAPDAAGGGAHVAPSKPPESVNAAGEPVHEPPLVEPVSCHCYWESDNEPSNDTSSESDATCTGDASGSDNSCTGDSASSSEPNGEACSGDGSEPSNESCSGDGSVDTAGETCAGSSDESGAECSLTRRMLPRPRLSVLCLVLAACVLPWRRAGRRRRLRGCRQREPQRDPSAQCAAPW